MPLPLYSNWSSLVFVHLFFYSEVRDGRTDKQTYTHGGDRKLTIAALIYIHGFDEIPTVPLKTESSYHPCICFQSHHFIREDTVSDIVMYVFLGISVVAVIVLFVVARVSIYIYIY